MLLRQEFTQQLLQSLLSGENINLISPHGQGRRRTIQDILMLLADDVVVFQIDLKRFTGNLNLWLKQTVDELRKNKQLSIVIVHNGEVMDVDLLPLWQSITHMTYCGFLCVLEQQDQSVTRNILSVELPPITKQQLVLELKKRHLPIDATEFGLLAAWLLDQEFPYSHLDGISDEWYKRKVWK